jgi:hypothetical protein
LKVQKLRGGGGTGRLTHLQLDDHWRVRSWMLWVLERIRLQLFGDEI